VAKSTGLKKKTELVPIESRAGSAAQGPCRNADRKKLHTEAFFEETGDCYMKGDRLQGGNKEGKKGARPIGKKGRISQQKERHAVMKKQRNKKWDREKKEKLVIKRR